MQDHVRSVLQPNMIHRMKSGTAFFVDDYGALLTARHAVDDCVRVIVSKEGGSVAARVVAPSSRFDPGLITVPKTLGIAAVFPRNAAIGFNDMVFASAYNKLPDMIHRGGTLANATVSSSFGEQETGYLVIDTDVTFGASGAPVLDSRGLVEGVISSRSGFTKVLARTRTCVPFSPEATSAKRRRPTCCSRSSCDFRSIRRSNVARLLSSRGCAPGFGARAVIVDNIS